MSKQGIAVIVPLVLAVAGSGSVLAQDGDAEAQEAREAQATQSEQTAQAQQQAQEARLVQLQRELERQEAQRQRELELAEDQRQRELDREAALLERELVAQETQRQRELAQEERALQQAEVQRARAEIEQARREMEQAARTIAEVQYARLPELENLQVQLGEFEDVFVGFGNQARIGASVVDAEQGALVTRLTPGSGAETAGLMVGDVIQSVNGTAVATADEPPTAMLREEIRNVEPGETVALVVERAGRTIELDVVTERGFGGYVGQIPRNGIRVSGTEGPNVSVMTAPGVQILRGWGFASSPWSDMELVAMSEALGRYFDTNEGLLVLRAPEDDAIDIRDGDVILAISGRTPNSPEHAIRILSSFESGETVEFSIMREGRRESVEYVVPEQSATFWRSGVPAAAPLTPATPTPPAAPVPTPD